MYHRIIQKAELNPEKAAIIYDYIIAERSEINIKESTKGKKARYTEVFSKETFVRGSPL